ncbi:MAG: hypothetical protein EXR72_07720 [Myxococcales bacterium]|nr:hypothetical protein [Myxococcales bacterium]
MALKDMSTAQMIHLTSPWVTKDHPDRAALAAIPCTAALLPILEAAHADLLAAQPYVSEPERLSFLQVQERDIDLRHDDLMRGVFAMVTGMAFLARDMETRALYTAVRDLCLPDGIAATQRTYKEEAGEALLLKARLTPEARALLARVKTPEGSLADAVGDWMALAGQLGQLEEERDGLIGSAPRPADRRAARNQWIRTVNTIAANLDLVGGASVIRERIEDSARATARRASEPVPEPEGAPGDDPPPVEVTVPSAAAA